VGIHRRSLGEEGPEVGPRLQERLQRRLGIAREPAERLAHLRPGGALLRGVADGARLDAGDAHPCEARAAAGGHMFGSLLRARVRYRMRSVGEHAMAKPAGPDLNALDVTDAEAAEMNRIAHPLVANPAPDADDRLPRIDSTPDGMVFITINRPNRKN